ncbi:MAG: UDP-2,3-diacylglucosamine diphosphatase LpxI, partial [Elusimicrobia bacterium]|nr:UDP-2,3-diacylglucosamine diphosphatase LpxI [Elusimicrobiota bacterium]
PNQDERFDLPVVGVKTLEAMSAAGASLLAIEARKTLILEKDLFIQKAVDSKISVTVLTSVI